MAEVESVITRGEKPGASDIPVVNIRPGVSILSVLQHLNYKPWFAIAEFVDNSLQSYLSHKAELEEREGEDFQLRVAIEVDGSASGSITIRDNAAGISALDFPRAFRPAEVPPDRTGLSEFGMGMKSAACWFAQRWSVRTTALGEPIERTVNFDIDKIVHDRIEELTVRGRSVPVSEHYTEIVLTGLHKSLYGRTLHKIKDHLASIYRQFLREGILELNFENDLLRYEDPSILLAPYFKDQDGESLYWHKNIDLDFGLGLRAHGFAALRETASTSTAGFSLFRRKRLIQGSGDETYRPEFIFGKSNSYIYQRLFGEIALEGFGVSHTKDGFQWEEHEDIVLDELKRALDASPLPLLRQAEGFRSRQRSRNLQPGALIATERTAETIERELPPVLAHLVQVPVATDVPVVELPVVPFLSKRIIEVQIDLDRWLIELELSNDPAVGDWVSSYDTGQLSVASESGDRSRSIGIRLALAHPFMERFSGPDSNQIEPLLRVAVALVLAEITAREGGARSAGEIRRRVNEFLRDALSKP